MRDFKRYICLVTTTVLAVMGTSAMAQEPYPNKPIRLVIGYAAGGGSDLVGRMAGEQLRKMGAPVVIENVPGASQNIAATRVANSPADGYTIFFSTPALTINPWMFRSTGYKPAESFVPATLFGEAPNALIVPASLGVKTVGELVAHLKAKGGNFSSAGVGTTHHLSAEMFKQATGVTTGIEHIPFKGAGEALTAVMAGEVQFAFVSVPSAKALINSDKVRILGLTGAHKSTLMPGVPMLSEVGVKGMDIGTWYGLLLPAGTPRAIVDKINAVMRQDSAEFGAKLAGAGVDFVQRSPAEFEAFIKADIPRWGKLLENVKFDRQ